MAPEATTYRYLRLSLLALLLTLAISVAAETIRSGWQTSLSAYYYTAAGPIFIAVLGAVGVCLVALRGYTDAEETCLNLAGLSVPMVAFVPTPAAGHVPDVPAIFNNALTYLTVLALGFVVVLVVGRRTPRWPSPWTVVGLVSTALAWVVGLTWILADRTSFAAHAHVLAAVFTFLPFAGVVLLNTDWGVRVLAGETGASRTRFDRAYWAVFAGMALALVAFAVLRSWDFALLGLEVVLLALFALFWALQTLDLVDPARELARPSP